MEWVSSDHHFGHFNIIKYCNRPFNSLYQMNETMISKWNEVVKPDDTIYHLGDFAFFKKVDDLKDYINRLNGYKILIRGNHDKRKETMLEGGFDEVYDKLVIDRDDTKLLMSHRRISEMPTLNVSVELTGYYPIPLPTAIQQPLHLCGHTHDLWTINTSFMTATEQSIAEDSIAIWRRMESRSKGNGTGNEIWKDDKKTAEK